MPFVVGQHKPSNFAKAHPGYRRHCDTVGATAPAVIGTGMTGGETGARTAGETGRGTGFGAGTDADTVV